MLLPATVFSFSRSVCGPRGLLFCDPAPSAQRPPCRPRLRRNVARNRNRQRRIMDDEPDVPSNAAQIPPRIHRPVPLRALDTALHREAADEPTHALPQETPPSAHECRRSSDFLAQLNARLLRTYNARNEDAEERERERERDYATSPHNRSFPNLTMSTLSGIYDDVGSGTAGERSMAETPWGTGAETPAHAAMGMHAWETGMGSPDAGLSIKRLARQGTQRSQREATPKGQKSRQARQGASKYAVIVGKLAALYLFGAVYGLIVSHLHETRQLAAVHADAVNRRSWIYLASWGVFGVTLGSLLPYVDLVWGSQRTDGAVRSKESEKSDSPISEQINDVVRSVCAFVGIAFAIVSICLSYSFSFTRAAQSRKSTIADSQTQQRRLPWQSTLQLTLTLALVNPALWYILDRSKPGLSFSLIVTSILTSFIFLSNPDVLPSPSLPATTNITRLSASSTASGSRRHPLPAADQQRFAGVVTYENLAVVTWVGSVLFCSCVCFGSIGRRLAVLGKVRSETREGR